MTNFTRYESQEGIELVISVTGEAYATVAGYSQMAEKDRSVIQKRIKGCAPDVVETHQVLTKGGLQGCALIPAETVFEWLWEDNPKLAKAMGKAGATIFLQRLAGFKLEFKVVEQPKPPSDTQDLLLGVKFMTEMLMLGGLNEGLASGFAINGATRILPELKPEGKEAHKLLAATTDIPEVLLTPTVIGKELGISARKVNELLIKIGFQIKNPMKTGEKGTKTLPDYVPTTLGEPHADYTMATGMDKDNTTYQHTKWKQSIIGILSEYLA